MKSEYQKPTLHSLNEKMVAFGQCANGSVHDGDCLAGNRASALCNGGSTAFTDCTPGYAAFGANCTAGTYIL